MMAVTFPEQPLMQMVQLYTELSAGPEQDVSVTSDGVLVDHHVSIHEVVAAMAWAGQ